MGNQPVQTITSADLPTVDSPHYMGPMPSQPRTPSVPNAQTGDVPPINSSADLPQYGSPGYVGPPGEAALTQSFGEQYRNLMNNTPNAESEQAKINASLYLAGEMGLPLSTVYQNFDTITARYWGSRKMPESAWTAIQNAWKSGTSQVERAKIGYELMFHPENQSLYDQLSRIDSQMPPEDAVRRSLPVDVMKSIAGFLPQALDAVTTGQAQAVAAAGAGAAVGAAVDGVGAVPGAIAMYGIAKTAATAAAFTQQSVGAIAADLFTLKDPTTGQRIPPGIARAFAAGGGVLTAALGLVGIDKLTGGAILNNIVEKVARNIAAKDLISGAVKNRVLAWVAQHGVNVTEQTLLQVSQTAASNGAEELAKAVANQVQGSNIPPATFDQWKQELLNSAKSAAESFAIMSIPETVSQARNAIGTQRQTAQRQQEAARTAAETTNPEDVTPANIEDLKQRFMADPVAGFQDYASALDQMHRQQEEKQRQATDQAKAEQGPQPWQMTREQYSQTAPEPNTESAQIRQQADQLFANDPLRSAIAKNIPNMTPEEVDGAALLLEMRARSMGMSSDEWVNQYLAPDIFAKGDQNIASGAAGKKAAVTFLEDGKALFHATAQSDFSSWAHEMAHIFRRQLDDTQMRQAADWSGAVNGQWDTASEERFAQGFEQYLKEGKAPTPELGNIFQRFSEWLKRIYYSVRDRWNVNPQIRTVYDSILAGEKQGAQTDNGLFQSTSSSAYWDPGAGDYVFPQDTPLNLSTLSPHERFAYLSQIQDDIRNVYEKYKNEHTNSGSHERAIIENHFNELKPQTALYLEFSAPGIDFENPDQPYYRGMADGFLHDSQLHQLSEDIGNLAQTLDGAETSGSGDRFGAAEPNTLYQNDPHEEAVRQAVHDGQPVPDEVLQEYKRQDWAKAEIEKRQRIVDEARTFTDPAEFVDFNTALNLDDNPNAEEYYTYLWHQSQRQPPDPKVQNEKWLASMTKESLEAALGDMAFNNQFTGLHGLMVSAAKKVVAGGHITDAHYQRIMDQLRTHPYEYRETFAANLGDDEAQRQVLREQEQNPEAARLEKALSENTDLRNALGKRDKTVDTLKSQVRGLSSRIDRFQKMLKDAEVQRRADLEAQRAQMRDSRKSVSDALKSAKEEAKQTASTLKREAAARYEENDASLRDALKSAIQEYKLEKQVNDYTDWLIKGILRKPSAAVEWEYAKKIEAIQRRVEPKTPAWAIQLRRDLREYVARHPEKQQPPDVLNEINIKSVREMTIGELEKLKKEVDDLRHIGTRIRAQKTLDETVTLMIAKQQLKKAVLRGNPLQAAQGVGSKETQKEQRTSITKKIAAETLRMNRLSNMLDGGKPGPFTKWLCDEVNNATDAEIRGVDQRIENGKSKMKELGITPAALGKQLTVDGFTYTIDEVMSFYLGMKNEDSAKAIVHGNKVPIPTVQKFIKQLTPHEIQWADYMMDSFGKANFDRLHELMVELENRGLERVDHYFPMKRQGVDYSTLDQEVAADLLGRSGYKRSYVGKGFTLSRIKIGDEHQLPIRLGATNLWMDQTAKQEKLLNSGRLVKRLHRVFQDKPLRAAITQMYGKDYNRVIEKYINDFANPNIYQMPDAASSISRMLRQNAAVSYLAFNAVTMLKQVPSVFFYLQHATPGHLLGAVGELFAKRGDLARFIYERDPQMKHRSIDRWMEELKVADRGIYDKVVKRVGTVGMWPIAMMDKIATLVGWKATYNRYVRAGASEEEAVKAAQSATLLTQPAARAKDVAQIYRTNEGFNWFLMFSNQLNQIWNMLAYDIPNDIRNGNIGSAVMTMTGIALGGMAMGLIARKSLPKNVGQAVSDVGLDVVKQVLSAVPIVGGAIGQGMDGWASSGIDPIPGATKAGAAIGSLFDPNKDLPTKLSDIAKVLPDAMVSVGLPTIEPKRVIKTISTGDFWELVGGPPKE